jgi:hypothetical protein
MNHFNCSVGMPLAKAILHYEKHSENAVQHCGGLPLALQVLGSSLNGKGADACVGKRVTKIRNNS